MFHAELLEILNIKNRCLDFLGMRLFCEVLKLTNQRARMASAGDPASSVTALAIYQAAIPRPL
jgi:hypothetical protein